MRSFAVKLSAHFSLKALLRLGIGFVFLFAGLSKLWYPYAFYEEVIHYQILPDALIAPFVWFLPTLEVVLSGCLICGVWAREASVLLLGLLVIFIVAVGATWVRGLNIDCGCFGEFKMGNSYLLWILRDLLLAVGLVYVIGKR